jgi:hypothetical protein
MQMLLVSLPQIKLCAVMLIYVEWNRACPGLKLDVAKLDRYCAIIQPPISYAFNQFIIANVIYTLIILTLGEWF